MAALRVHLGREEMQLINDWALKIQ